MNALMKTWKKSLILLLIPLFAFTTAHKFYVSVTNIGYSEKDDALQITSRIFIDDLEAVFKERYDFKGKLTSENDEGQATLYLKKYLNTKFQVSINGQVKPSNYIGNKFDNDVIIVFIEVPEIELSKAQYIEIRNQILTDLFDEQQNILHFKINGVKKSYVLSKENVKGVLNL